MDLSADALIASMVVSTAGLGLFVYGKKQLRIPQLGVGIALMLLPMVTASAGATWAIGGGLVALLAVLVRGGL